MYEHLEKSGVLLASAERTASVNSDIQINEGFRGVKVCIDVTDVPGAAPSIVFTIKERDPVSGKFNTLLASAAVIAEGTTWLTVYPGVTVAANVAASTALSREWRLEAVAGDADAATYSASFLYLI